VTDGLRLIALDQKTKRLGFAFQTSFNYFPVINYDYFAR
jgi:hypothetical protein